MNPRRTSSAVLISLVIGATLSFAFMRKVLFQPGLVELTSDFSIHYDIEVQRSAYLNTWNQYVFDFDNSPILSMMIVYFPLYLLPNSEYAQKTMIFIVYTLMFVTMFVVSFVLLREKTPNTKFLYGCAGVAAYLYSVNGWTATELVHWFALWSHALVPLLFYFAFKGMSSSSLTDVFRCGIISAFLIVLNGHAHGIASSVLVVLTIFVVLVLTGSGHRFLYLRNGVLYLAFLAVAGVPLAGYFSLPYISHFSGQVASGPSWLLDRIYEPYLVSREIGLLNALKLFRASWQETYLAILLPESVLNLATILAFSLPTVAIVTFVLKCKDMMVRTMAGIFAVFIFLAKGLAEPLSNVSYWFALDAPLISNFSWLLFRAIYLYIGYLALPYAVVTAILFVELGIPKVSSSNAHKRISLSSILRKSILLFLVSLLLFSATLSGSPLLSGDLNGYASPVNLPQDYQKANAFLSEKEEVFRVAWFPPSSSVIWAQYVRLPSIPQFAEISPLAQWASAKPVLSYGVTYLLPTRPRIFPQLFTFDSVSSNSTNAIGKVLGIAGVKYVVYHNDTIDYLTYEPFWSNLNKQEDMQPILKDGNITIFENKGVSPYVFVADKMILAIGGYDIFKPLSRLTSYYPDRCPILFLEQSNSLAFDLFRYKDFSDILIFYGDKDLNDIVLDSLPEKYLLFPADAVKRTRPITQWEKDFFYSWQWVPNILTDVEGTTAKGIKYDLDLGHKIIYTTSPNASLALDIDIDHYINYDIWIRLLRNPRGGPLTTFLDDNEIASINSFSKIIQGFKWVRLGVKSLTKGKHNLILLNEKGFNAISSIAIVPKFELLEHQDKLLKSLGSLRLVQLIEKQFYKEMLTNGSINLTYWRLGNGLPSNEIVLDIGNEFVPGSVLYRGKSDTNGFFYVSFDSPTVLDLSKRENVDFWIKTTKSPVIRFYVEDVNGNVRSYIRNVSPNEWTYMSINLNEHYFSSATPVDLTRIKLLNFGFPGIPEEDYSLGVYHDLIKKSRSDQFRLLLPRSSYYVIAFENVNNGSGFENVLVDNVSFSATARNNSSFSYVGPLYMEEGSHNLTILRSVEQSIGSTYVYSVRSNASLMVESVFNYETSLATLTYRRESIDSVFVNVNSNSPFIISLNEGFSDFWKLFGDGMVVQKIPLNGITNGFLISTPGNYSFRTQYTPQETFKRGVEVSLIAGTTILLLYFCLTYNWRSPLKRLFRKFSLSKKRALRRKKHVGETFFRTSTSISG